MGQVGRVLKPSRLRLSLSPSTVSGRIQESNEITKLLFWVYGNVLCFLGSNVQDQYGDLEYKTVSY